MGPPTDNRPKVIAHRGASATAAEHTLRAYENAIELGADGVECDVRLTADGHLVCVHDPRIDRTSDGRGRVSNKTLPQLMGHDFASWWTPEQEQEAGLPRGVVPGYDEERSGILTLDRLLELVTSVERPVEVAVETKHPTRYGGYVEQAVLQSLQRFGLVAKHQEESSAYIMSFSSVAVRRVREMAPTVPSVFLMDKLNMAQRSGQLPVGTSIIGPGLPLAREYAHLIHRWKKRGHPLFIWTIDDEQSLRDALRLRVDAVITNRPRQVHEWLDGLGEVGDATP